MSAWVVPAAVDHLDDSKGTFVGWMDGHSHVNARLNNKRQPSSAAGVCRACLLPFKRGCGGPAKFGVGRCGCKCEKLPVTCGCCLFGCSGGATQTPSE